MLTSYLHACIHLFDRPHDWASLSHRVFIHGCKREGLLNASELALAAKFPILTVEKGQGEDLPGYAEVSAVFAGISGSIARPCASSLRMEVRETQPLPSFHVWASLNLVLRQCTRRHADCDRIALPG